MNVITIADRLWRQELSIDSHHPFTHLGDLVDVADDVAFVPSFANVTALRTDDGLVLIDTGGHLVAGHAHAQVRRWSDDRLHTAVYSHGHIDHVFGVGLYEEEARRHGWPAPQVVAHEALPARFDRYRLTAGYNAAVNRRQFQIPDLQWPTDYRYPDRTYRDHCRLQVGELALDLHHARGETDDHTWTWIPDRRVLCCGDLFIWASPNAGNPQKVQRYPAEWARALRQMADLGAEVLLPGHGFPVIGSDRVHQALTDTAELLESLHDQTVALMNEGRRLDEVVAAVTVPEHLLTRPYLQPIYDEPEFVVRNIWRLYGGWYDGNPATLKPARERDLAVELAALAGGAGRLAERARELLDEGNDRLAGHLAELAALADPGPETHQARAAVYAERADRERSTMARGVFAWAARESADAPRPAS